jgi:hypothetical protein
VPAGSFFVVDIGVFGRSWSPIQSAMQNELPIDLSCSGYQHAMVILEVETLVIQRFNIDFLVDDLRL